MGSAVPGRRINAMNTDTRAWKPHVTVAALIGRDGKFLLVEEETELGALYNQPAGHFGPDASLVTGAIRESLKLMTYCN